MVLFDVLAGVGEYPIPSQPPNRHNTLGVEDVERFQKPRATIDYLPLQRFAVRTAQNVTRTARHKVCKKHRRTNYLRFLEETSLLNCLIEELTGPSNERRTLDVFSLAWTFSDENNVRRKKTLPENVLPSAEPNVASSAFRPDFVEPFPLFLL